MKKKLIALLVVVVLVFSAVFVLAACNNNKKITVWVSEKEGVKTLTEQQIAAFIEAHPDYSGWDIAVQGMTEGDAAGQMVSDVKSGADIFCFAQDQLGRLYDANALSKLGKAGKDAVALNDAGAVNAVSISGDMYAYPITSDNTYFMYYNKEIIDASHVGSLNAIVQDCIDAGYNISYEVGGSAWYTASFFFGAGATSSWTLDGKTKKWTAADTFNSDKGLIALEGMQIMTRSGAWVNSSKASDLGAATPSAVVVSGTWDAEDAQKALGDKLGVAKLPSYTVGGTDYQLKSYMGYKLMGVKNHSDSKVHAFCHELAMYLSGKDCQNGRFKKFNWGPSNKELQASTAVAANAILKAVADQAQYSVVQGQIHGGWWDFAKLLGSRSEKWDDRDVTTTAGRQAILDAYTVDLQKYEQMTDEDMNAFGVIGSIASLTGVTENLAAGQTAWANWGADLAMVEDPAGTWISKVAVVLAGGDEFQVRQGQAWSVQFGAVGDDGNSTKNNFKITAENAGTYKIKLVLTKNDKGEIVSGVVSLVPAE